MNGEEKVTGVGWALPSALLGFAAGLLLAAQYLPLSASSTGAEPSPQCVTPVSNGEPATTGAAVDKANIASPASQPPAQTATTANVPPARPGGQKNPFDYNYALASHGATATGGSRPELLIDGNVSQYDGGNGYAFTNWSLNAKTRQAFVVTLKEPSTLNVVRFLLWDKNHRFYRYKLEACAERTGDNWFLLADRSREPTECRGWQVIVLEPRAIARLRLTGTFNSANSAFHVVELEAYSVPGGLEYPWIETEF